MRISKLMLPAVTVAGALALAGCGGGSGTTPLQPGGDNRTCAQRNLLDAPGGGCETPAQRAQRLAQGIINAEAETEYAGQIRWRLRDLSTQNEDDHELRTSGKPDALETKGTVKVMAGTLEGYEYSGSDPDTGFLTRGVVIDTQAGPSDVKTNASNRVAKLNAPTGTTDALIAGVDASDGKVNFDEATDAPYSKNVVSAEFKKERVTSKTDGDNFDGTFFGVAGKYHCVGATCTATRSNSGIQLTSGNWEFRPTAKDDAVFKVPDTAYQQFGWWITEDDGEPELVGLFHGSKDLAARAPGTPGPGGDWLQTKAKYTGGAAGYYANYREDDAGQDTGTSDPFTADVELNAEFAAANTVSGKIHDFMVDGTARPEWQVNLLRQNLEGGTPLDFTTTVSSSQDPRLNRSSDGRDGLSGSAAVRTDNSNIRWFSGGNRIGTFGGYVVHAYGGGATAAPDELGGYFKVHSDNGVLAGGMAATHSTE